MSWVSDLIQGTFSEKRRGLPVTRALGPLSCPSALGCQAWPHGLPSHQVIPGGTCHRTWHENGPWNCIKSWLLPAPPWRLPTDSGKPGKLVGGGWIKKQGIVFGCLEVLEELNLYYFICARGLMSWFLLVCLLVLTH